MVKGRTGAFSSLRDMLRRRGKSLGKGLLLGGSGFALAALVFGVQPAEAQPDGDPQEDMVAFLSLAEFAGSPTLVVEAGHEQGALDRLEAIPVDGSYYTSPLLDPTIVFTVHTVGQLPVASTGDPDKDARVFWNRACIRTQDIDVTVDCVLITDPDHDHFGRWELAWDPPKDRCHDVVPGEYCVEFVAVGWHFQYFYDASCTQEVPGSHVEKNAYRCRL